MMGHIHHMCERLCEVACDYIDSTDPADVDMSELGAVTDAIKDLCEAEYYAFASGGEEPSGIEGAKGAMSTIRRIWSGADPQLRAQLKSDMTKFMSEMS